MKRKIVALSAIALMIVSGLFVFEHVTSAQRPDRDTQPGQGQRGQRPGGDRGDRGNRGGMMDINNLISINPVSIVENSWTDLTFNVGVDDETLMKARPIYEATRKNFQVKMKEIVGKYSPKVTEAFASGDQRAAFQTLQQIREDINQDLGALLKSSGTEFQGSLKNVMSKEHMTKLNELTRERQAKMQQRTNRFRGGEGGQRGGQGGQRGQRPSQ